MIDMLWVFLALPVASLSGYILRVWHEVSDPEAEWNRGYDLGWRDACDWNRAMRPELNHIEIVTPENPYLV